MAERKCLNAVLFYKRSQNQTTKKGKVETFKLMKSTRVRIEKKNWTVHKKMAKTNFQELMFVQLCEACEENQWWSLHIGF